MNLSSSEQKGSTFKFRCEELIPCEYVSDSVMRVMTSLQSAYLYIFACCHVLL